MDFATNNEGFPIFVTNPADAAWVRLFSDAAAGTIVQPDATVVAVNGTR